MNAFRSIAKAIQHWAAAISISYHSTARLLTIFFLLVIPSEIQAQFTYTIENGAITITGYDCTKGGMVAIPGSINGLPVRSIGVDAFYSCDGLISVIIPNGVTNIEGGAFKVCESLTTVTLPNTLVRIADMAFSDCRNLTNCVLPNSLISIGEDAFYSCDSLTNVFIPNSVTTIGNRAFRFCANLISVSIANSVTDIGDWAFSECHNLKSAYFEGPPPECG